jgi:hypothetical protein
MDPVNISPLEDTLAAGRASVRAIAEEIEDAERCEGCYRYHPRIRTYQVRSERLRLCPDCEHGYSYDADVRELEAVYECIYCGAEHGDDGLDPPAPDDDEEWKRVAALHAPTCEWVETRAHSEVLGSTERDARAGAR